MIDDLQDAIAAKGPIGEDDLKNNYNQYIAGSRTHKNNSSNKHQQNGLHSQLGNSNTLTNQTMYLFKSHGSTERVHSSSNPKNPLSDTKFKKEFLKQKASNREVINRSAMNTKPDPNAITIPFGKSPDRSKNMSVYSQGPSHGGSSNIIAPSKSPYLGVNVGTNKKRTDSQQYNNTTLPHRNTKKDSLLANANYKNQMLVQNQIHSSTGRSANDSQTTHSRTKSQNAASVNLKLSSVQNYQQKIAENNNLIKNIGNQN